MTEPNAVPLPDHVVIRVSLAAVGKSGLFRVNLDLLPNGAFEVGPVPRDLVPLVVAVIQQWSLIDAEVA